MSTLVFITKECRAEVQKAGMYPELDAFKTRVEKNGDILFHRFPVPFFVKKKFGNKQGRLIAANQSFDVDGETFQVIIFLVFITRADTDYGRFCRNPNEEGQRYLDRINENEIREYIRNCLQTNPPEPLPILDDAQLNYLYGNGIEHIIDEEMICESEKWVEEICKPKYEHWLGAICTTLIEGLKNNRNEPCYTLSVQNSHIQLLISYYPRLKKHFLIGLDADNGESFEDLIKKQSTLLNLDDTAVNDDPQLLICKIRRMYPEDVLLKGNGNFWIDIQKNPYGNFALSDEEIQILNPAPDMRNRLFPLFINGRAGSGKSTVLQYLFTDYLCSYLVNTAIGYPPGYLTYNEALLDNAKKLVNSLLRCNPSIATKIENADLSEENFVQIFGQAFKGFRSYLLSLVPQDGQKRFADQLTEQQQSDVVNQRYGSKTGRQIFDTVRDKSKSNSCINRFIGYSQFKKIWELYHGQDLDARKNYGPDICWHVIRSYIKGMSVDEYVEPSDYDLLDKGSRNAEDESTHFHKTVTDEIFKTVFERVWKAWYEPLTNSATAIFWDDQDLVRYLLDNDCIQPSFAGIFCDESQDFTRIDLEAILRLSLFSKKKIQPDQIPFIPFAFAGDEFQTLNPTGFRWDTVKAWFTEKFIFALDPNNKTKHRVNFQELHNNYRSQAQIVQFSNRVQLLRAARLGITTLKPQEPWNRSEGKPVIYFNLNANDFWNQTPKGIVLIVPCEDQASVPQYIREKLKDRISLDENNTPNEMTVLSASEAKGQEFDCVAVYGFAESCPPNFITPFVNDRVTLISDAATNIPLEYFINKVYVAVTRAKQRLIIVDEFKNAKNDYFWQPFLNNETVDGKIRNKVPQSVWTDSVLTDMLAGDSNSLRQETKVNLGDLATDLANKGRVKDNPNPGLLRQAAKKYAEIGNETEAKRCRAEANQFEGKFRAAADGFREIRDDDRAIDNYWALGKTEGWKEIIAYNDRVNRIEVRFAEVLMQSKLTIVQTLTVLREIVSELRNESSKMRILESPNPYLAAIKFLVEKFNVNNTGEGRLALRDVKTVIQEINTLGLSCSAEALWKAATEIQDEDFILDLYKDYENSANSGFQEVCQAIIEKRTAYPASLSYMLNRKDYAAIIDAFGEHTDTVIDKETVLLIIDAMQRQKQFDNVEVLLPFIRSVKEYGELAKHLKDIDVVLSAKCQLLEIIASIENQTGSSEWEHFLVRNQHDKKLVFFVVRALARSSFENLNKGEFSDAVNFLQEHFVETQPEIEQKYWLEIGVMIERMGKRIDALNYYERVLRKATAEFSAALKKRLIVCKERHATALKDKDKEHKERLKSEAQTFRKELGIGNTKLPDYPTFSWEELYQDIATFNETIPKVNPRELRYAVHAQTFFNKNETTPKVNPIGSSTMMEPIKEKALPVLSDSQTVFAGFVVERFSKRINFTDAEGKTLSLVGCELKSADFEIKNSKVIGTSLVFDLSEDTVKIHDTRTGFILSIQPIG